VIWVTGFVIADLFRRQESLTAVQGAEFRNADSHFSGVDVLKKKRPATGQGEEAETFTRSC
jgi:hypothetical protein